MIIVEISIASMNTKYDFEIDEDTKLRLIMEEINDILSRKTRSPIGKTSGNFILCDINRSRVLDPNLTVEQNGLRSGSQLILL